MSELTAPKPGDAVELRGEFRNLELAEFPEIRAMVDCRNFVGEGPIWQPLDGSIWWVDVFAPAIYRLDTASGAVSHRPLPKRAAAVVPRSGGGVVVVLRSALAALETIDGEVRYLAIENFELNRFRFNDAKVDDRGRVWVGTFDPAVTALDGTLRCIGGTPLAMSAPFDRGMGVSNGIGWSPDRRTMYFTDTLAKLIYAYDFDLDSGTASNRRVCVKPKAAAGALDGPDGLAVDRDGNVWSAQFGSWRIDCYAPNGTLLRSVRMPTARPTSCIFGGKDLSTLYVTTATMLLTTEELAAQPYAGSLLVLDVGTAGTPVGSFVGA